MESGLPASAILKIIAYLVAFPLAGVLLVRITPYWGGNLIVTGDILLFFTVTAFMVGWKWEEPERTSKERTLAKRFTWLFPLYLTGIDLQHAIAERHFGVTRLLSSALPILIVPPLVVIPFVLGRTMGRKRGRWKTAAKS